MIEIRPALAEEIPQVLELWAAATDLRDSDTAEALAHLVARQALLVALDGTQITGSVVAGWDGWRGNIYRLAVSPMRRRQGIATALVVEAERRLRAGGARRLSILVAFDEPEAVLFWSSLDGVHQDERMRRYIKDLD